MTAITDEPLIYTSRGNVPIASLRYEHKWTDTDEYTKFEEIWYAEDGELVKNNCHVRSKTGMAMGGQQYSGPF